MTNEAAGASAFTFAPLTGDRWADLVELFGPRGATGGCWCMWWRLGEADFQRQKGEGNKEALRGLVEAGRRPGILAYADDRPVGWCAVAPREEYPRLERSRVLARVDGRSVWSIVCFFVARRYRGQGLSVGLVEAAVGQARREGAEVVEAYPVEPKARRTADVFAYTGIVSSFRRAGFVEVARRSPTRPIMRRYLVADGG